jgi:hypothetical protein
VKGMLIALYNITVLYDASCYFHRSFILGCTDLIIIAINSLGYGRELIFKYTDEPLAHISFCASQILLVKF